MASTSDNIYLQLQSNDLINYVTGHVWIMDYVIIVAHAYASTNDGSSSIASIRAR